jgi:hypothetical protein
MVAGCGGHHGGPAGHSPAEHGGRPRAWLRQFQPACRKQHGCGLREQRSRTGSGSARTSCMSAVAAARTAGVHAGGRCAVGGRTPVRAGDRRRHRHGHRHQPGHVCRTAAVRRRSFRKQRTVNPLIVPARYNFLYSSSRRRVCQRARSSRLWRRPALRAASGRPPARQPHDGHRGIGPTSKCRGSTLAGGAAASSHRHWLC